MKYVVNLEGHDGLFSCKTEFKCGDEFFARGISNYGDDDIDYLSNELAKDISGEIYAHFEEVIQEAETNGEDSEKAWEEQHDENNVYRYRDGDDYWEIAIQHGWGVVTDTVALTTGEAIMPHLREELEAYIARTA